MTMMSMSHTTPQASPAGPSAAAYRPSPSSAAGTPSSSSSLKPRLLYRGPLRLSDGTLLNGVAFVSTVDPFDKGEGGSGAGGGADDADICLALEMARGQRCLAIEAMSDLSPSTTTPTGLIKHSGVNNNSAAGWDIHLEASGKIRMYIDPNERLTAAFFERNFCCGGEGWDDERGKERSRTAFLISTGPSIPAATTAIPQAGPSQAQHEDVFTNSYTAASSSSAMAAPLPLVERRSAALQLVLFARMSDASAADGVLEIVVGRRVAQRRRATGGPKVEGAAVAGGSAATVSRRASQGVRPDDPLPRVAGGIVGQKVKQPEVPPQPAPAGPSTTWRKTASAPNLVQPSTVPPPARGVAKASADGGADTSLMSVKEEDDDDDGHATAAAASSRATSAGARGASSTAPAITGGNHTPGRRGEKRRSTTTTATAKQQQQRSQEHLLLSPTSSSKRRRTALAPTSAILAKGSASSSSSSGAPHRPDPLPLQPLQPPQPRIRRDAASPTPGLDAPPLSATLAPPKASSSSATYNAIETKNRAMIKKLVQHQLLGRGLERRRPAGPGGQGGGGREGSVDPTLADEDVAAQDGNDGEAGAGDAEGDEDEEEDFDRLFLGAYTSTCVALRKDLHKKTVRRDVAARVVRWHLDLYLEDRDCAMGGGGGGGGAGAEA